MFFFHIKCVIISFTLKQLAWHFMSTSSRIIFVSENIGFWQYVQISLSIIFLQKQWCECEYSVTEEVRICKVQLNYWTFQVTYKLFQQFLMCRCLRDLQVCGEVMPLKCKFHILYLGKILHLIKHSTSHCTCCQCKLCRFLWSSYDRYIHNCKKKKKSSNSSVCNISSTYSMVLKFSKMKHTCHTLRTQSSQIRWSLYQKYSLQACANKTNSL